MGRSRHTDSTLLWGGTGERESALTRNGKENRVCWGGTEGWRRWGTGRNYDVEILRRKNVCGTKTKTSQMNVAYIYSKACFWFVPVCARLCWVVVYGQLSAPQGHHTNRDSRGLGPSPSGTPWTLKSCHVRAAVHCSVADLQCCSSGREIWPGTRFPPPPPPNTWHTCTQMPVAFPFHKHLPNDEKRYAFNPKAVFSHSRRGWGESGR